MVMPKIKIIHFNRVSIKIKEAKASEQKKWIEVPTDFVEQLLDLPLMLKITKWILFICQ